PRGRDQVEPDHPGQRPADGEEDGQEDQVQDGDPLVVDGEQPRPEAVTVLQVAHVTGFGLRLLVDEVGLAVDGGAHYLGPPPSVDLAGGGGSVMAPTGAGACSFRSGVSPLRSDLRYAITLTSSSSLTLSGPKWGMIGSHPSRTLARGLRIDS